MRECLTTATPKYSSEVKPLLVQAFPVGQTRWISAPPSMAQDRSGLQWVAHRDSAPGPQLPPQAAISQLYLLLPHFQKQGRACIPGRDAEFLLHALNDLVLVSLGTLGWVLFPWPGCPWLLQDHPGGHWPVLDEMQLPVCWEEKGPQPLANHPPCRSQNSCLLITFPDW